MREIERLFAEYQELVRSQELDERELDYAILERHMQLLEPLDQVGSACIAIFDMHKQTHSYLSRRFFELLDYDRAAIERDDIAYIDSRCHPDDLLILTRNGIEAMKHFISLPLERKREYKLVSEYRVRRTGGSYVRVIEQQQVLELDPRGNVWLALCLTEFSPNQDIASPATGSIVNYKTGEAFQVGRSDLLSSRETEILGLVKDGFASKQIAGQLSISIHTVNTHRQRIIEKLGVANSIEAVGYAQRLGLLA
jgi:DNA-binding CsgD family transcriptional regulator